MSLGCLGWPCWNHAGLCCRSSPALNIKDCLSASSPCAAPIAPAEGKFCMFDCQSGVTALTKLCLRSSVKMALSQPARDVETFTPSSPCYLYRSWQSGGKGSWMPVALGCGSPLALAGPPCYHRATADDAPGLLAGLLDPLRKSTLRCERYTEVPMSVEEWAVGGSMVSPPRNDICDPRFDSL